MVFEVNDYHELVDLLRKHPEWREELRRLLLSEDFLALPQEVRELSRVVRELAEAQKRSEERLTRLEQTVAELAKAQKRSEERLTRLEQTVAELAEAQKRSEERLTRLEQTVAELAEAQKRTEQAVAELAEAQKRTEERLTRVEIAQARTDERLTRLEQRVDRLAYEMGGLKAAFGATLEEEAASVVEFVMRHKGYRLLGDAVNLRLNGEVDVALRVEDAQGQQYSVLVESKARLSRRDVQAWVQRMRSAGWQKRLSKAGFPPPYLVYVFAIRADVGAREAVAEHGIGLLRGEGEMIAPTGSIG
jgi:DNA repair ATPase RecN